MNRIILNALLLFSVSAFAAKTVEMKSHNLSALGSDQSVFIRPEPLNFPNAYIYSGGLNATDVIYGTTQFNIGGDATDNIQSITGQTIAIGPAAGGQVLLNADPGSSTYSLQFPPNQAVIPNEILINDGTGVLSWVRYFTNLTFSRIVQNTSSPIPSNHSLTVATTLSAPITYTLAAATTWTVGQIATIKDESGTAGTNTITIASSGGDTIDGASSITISTNYGSVNLYCDGVSKFYVWPTGVQIVGTFDGNTASASGISILGSSIFAQSASATNPGMVNTTTQTFIGAKTFSTSVIGSLVQGVDSTAGSAIVVRGGAGTSGNGASITVQGGNSTSGTGGATIVQGGIGTAGVGGALTVKSGNSASASTGAAASIAGGSNTGGGAGGALSLNGGSTNNAGNGGHLRFSGGGSTSGTPGSIQFFFPNAGTTFGNAGMILDEKGNVTITPAAIATTATDRFLYLSGMAGTPTGVPTAKTGSVPLAYDTTNGFLYAYNGAWNLITKGLIEVFTGSLPAPTNGTYTLDESAKYPYTVNEVTVSTTSGTATLDFQIGGVDITGMNAVAASSVQGTSTASAANAVVAGNKLTFTVSSASTPVNLSFTLKYTR